MEDLHRGVLEEFAERSSVGDRFADYASHGYRICEPFYDRDKYLNERAHRLAYAMTYKQRPEVKRRNADLARDRYRNLSEADKEVVRAAARDRYRRNKDRKLINSQTTQEKS